MNNKQLRFINKAIKKHGDKYDYSEVIYIDSYTHVIIYCKHHQSKFSQKPYHHLAGSGGCIKCMTDNSKEKFKMTKENFIQKANDVHENKYEYDSVIYVNNRTPITIYCKKHKKYFNQLPTHHLRKAGCPTCGGKEQSNTEDFIAKAITIYGDKYSYDFVDYITARIKVIITCKTHGNFETTPDSFLRGSECPKCYSSFSKKQIDWLNSIMKTENIYIQHAENDGEYTIPNTRYRADGYCKETNTMTL